MSESIKRYFKIGDKLKKMRTDLEMNQTQFSKLLKITRSTYSNYENNNRVPDEKTLIRIANILEIPLNDLLATQEDIDKLFDDPNAFNNAALKNEIVEAAFVVSNYFFKEEPKTAEINIMINNKDSQGMTVTVEKKVLLKDRFSDKDYLKYKIQRYENLLEKILDKDKDKDYLDHKMNYYKGLQNPKAKGDTPESENRESTQEDIDKLFD